MGVNDLPIGSVEDLSFIVVALKASLNCCPRYGDNQDFIGELFLESNAFDAATRCLLAQTFFPHILIVVTVLILLRKVWVGLSYRLFKGGELASPRWWFPTLLGKEGICGFGVGDIGCINDAKLECYLFNSMAK